MSDFSHERFTNPDLRLRPRDLRIVAAAEDEWHNYRGIRRDYDPRDVFPELTNSMLEMQRKAGLVPFPLLIVHQKQLGKEYAEVNMTLRDPIMNVVIFGSKLLNSFDYGEVNAAIGHEVAHIWLDNRWDLEVPIHLPPEALARLNRTQIQEIKADIIGAYLSGDPAAMISSLRKREPSTDGEHPPEAIRIRALQNMDMQEIDTLMNYARENPPQIHGALESPLPHLAAAKTSTQIKLG